MSRKVVMPEFWHVLVFEEISQKMIFGGLHGVTLPYITATRSRLVNMAKSQSIRNQPRFGTVVTYNELDSGLLLNKQPKTLGTT